MVAGSSRAPGCTRRREISRNTLPSHWVNLNGGTSLASSIAGLSASTCCRKRIQVLRMPGSPSGSRLRYGAVAVARVRNTVSAFGNGMLPTKWTIGLCAVAALIAAPSPYFTTTIETARTGGLVDDDRAYRSFYSLRNWDCGVARV